MSTVNPLGVTDAAQQLIIAQSIDTENPDGNGAGESFFADVLQEALEDIAGSTLPGESGDAAGQGAAEEASAFLSGMSMTALGTDTQTTDEGINITGAYLFTPETLLPLLAGMGMTDTPGTAGASGPPMPDLNMTLEQAIATASKSGEKNDAMTALLMMMMLMMMQTSAGGSGGGDMSILMPFMAAVMDQLQDKDRSEVYNDFLKTPDYSPQVLDTIDNEVFHTPPAEETDEEQAVLPLQCWKPAIPKITSDEYNRSPELYRAVVDQFNVETAQRYEPGRDGYTYCNVYVWDVTRAMGAEVPYYVDPVTGAPRQYPDVKDAEYNGARNMDKWLKTYGEKFGWRQVTAEQAQMHANQGKPVVTAAGDIGHVQMVVPSNDGSFDPVRGVTIAQAGRVVSNYMYISDLYGASTIENKVTYWAHD